MSKIFISMMPIIFLIFGGFSGFFVFKIFNNEKKIKKVDEKVIKKYFIKIIISVVIAIIVFLFTIAYFEVLILNTLEDKYLDGYYEHLYTSLLSPEVFASLIGIFGIFMTIITAYKNYKEEDRINRKNIMNKDKKIHITDNRMIWLLRMKSNVSELCSFFNKTNFDELSKVRKLKNLIIFDLNPVEDKRYIDFIENITKDINNKDKIKFRNSFNLMFKAEWEIIKEEVKDTEFNSISKGIKYATIQRSMLHEFKKIHDVTYFEFTREEVNEYFICDYINT